MKRVFPRSSRSARSYAGWRRALLSALACVATTAPLSAAEPAVVIGEVTAGPSGGALLPEFRRALVTELERTLTVEPRERFVLSAALVRLESQRDASQVRATAAVSLVLRRAKQQSLHAVLNGRATAQESGSDLASARDSALLAAVASAVRRLPEAVR